MSAGRAFAILLALAALAFAGGLLGGTSFPLLAELTGLAEQGGHGLAQLGDLFRGAAVGSLFGVLLGIWLIKKGFDLLKAVVKTLLLLTAFCVGLWVLAVQQGWLAW